MSFFLGTQKYASYRFALKTAMTQARAFPHTTLRIQEGRMRHGNLETFGEPDLVTYTGIPLGSIPIEKPKGKKRKPRALHAPVDHPLVPAGEAPSFPSSSPPPAFVAPLAGGDWTNVVPGWYGEVQ